MNRRLVIALLLCVLSLSTACYGPFNATSSLHHWNGTVTDSDWGNEFIFLGLNIIPVYGLWIIGDALIFNSFEFWGGPESNPIDPPGGSDG